MKSKEEIEQLAEKQYPIEIGGSMWMPNTNDIKKANEQEGYIKGYTQCQEDMADYIFKVAKEFHRLGKYSGNTSDTHFTDIYKETINSLNKQD
jgi:hypothetical protein